jgi:peptide/nickel transport system ATP-binding protein
VLEAKDLRVRYPSNFIAGGFLAVDGVDLRVDAGEVVGLVGESGSGKSTIGRAVIGLTPATATTLRICSQDMIGASGGALRQLRRKVSIVFQDPASSLNPRATVGSNITSPLRWNGIERDSRKLDAIGRELLERVNLPGDWVDRFPHELSGGQRQRVSIARAIAMRPQLMVADEPTSALDVTVQATILALLKELQRDFGFACLFISHDLSLVQQLSQRVVVLRGGKVVEQGPTSSVLGSPSDAYTRALVAAAPVPDPDLQRQRRLARQALQQADRPAVVQG